MGVGGLGRIRRAMCELFMDGVSAGRKRKRKIRTPSWRGRWFPSTACLATPVTPHPVSFPAIVRLLRSSHFLSLICGRAGSGAALRPKTSPRLARKGREKSSPTTTTVAEAGGGGGLPVQIDLHPPGFTGKKSRSGGEGGHLREAAEGVCIDDLDAHDRRPATKNYGAVEEGGHRVPGHLRRCYARGFLEKRKLVAGRSARE